MFKAIANYKHEDKEIVAVAYEGVYSVLAYINDVLVGSFDTEDEQEAKDVYFYNLDMMLA